MRPCAPRMRALSFMSIGNSAYAGLGGGVRVYVGENWGVKPEFRYER